MIEIVRMTRTTETGRDFLIEGFGKEGLIRQPPGLLEEMGFQITQPLWREPKQVSTRRQ